MGALNAPRGAKAMPAMFLTAVAMVLTITGCGELPLGDFHPELEDIQQGIIGDCGLLSVTGSLALRYPDIVRRRLPEGTQDNWVHEIEDAYVRWGGILQGAEPMDVYHFYGLSAGLFFRPGEIPREGTSILCTEDHTTILVHNHCYVVVSATKLYNPWGFYEDVDFLEIKDDINAIYFVKF